MALPFFILALDGGKWSASWPGRFTPMAVTPITLWIGGWADPRILLSLWSISVLAELTYLFQKHVHVVICMYYYAFLFMIYVYCNNISRPYCLELNDK
jgi:hypothetical protein